MVLNLNCKGLRIGVLYQGSYPGYPVIHFYRNVLGTGNQAGIYNLCAFSSSSQGCTVFFTVFSLCRHWLIGLVQGMFLRGHQVRCELTA